MADGKYQAWVILQDNFESEIIIPVNLIVDTYLGEPGTVSHAEVADIAVYPNPFREITSIRIRNSGSTLNSLYIADMQGIVVRSFFSSPIIGGNLQFSWDGRDDSGNLLPSGVYILKVISGESAEYARIVIIR
jgi:flagellar hook assembly protein FlgD